MQILLLGPLEVHAVEGPVPLPGAAERALLALLALSPGRTVPTSALIDQLWSEATLPSDPQNALQIRVSKLRRSLQNAGIDVLLRDSSGYRVDVEPGWVDVHRFVESLRTAGRLATAARGEPGAGEEALATFDAALALWRGDPLVDFAMQSWASVEAGRLSQLRLAATAERSAIALALGRHVEVVDHLTPMVANDPTREALVGLLMAALYGSGAQSDALEVYQRTRAALDDELGLEPSAPLREMHQRVLRQDPSLTTVPIAATHAGITAATTPEANLPHTLPAAVTPLIGRAAEGAALTDLLGTARLVTLVGPGGAGKTSLALAVSRALQDQFDDGAWVVRLAPITDSRQVAQAVAESLAVPVEGATPGVSPRQRLLSYLARRRLLLVVDNCEHVVDAAANLIDAILTSCPDVTVLATSREALAVSGETQFPVPPLRVPPPGTAGAEVMGFPAAQLLVVRARAVRASLRLDEPDLAAIAQVCQQLDGMPLALELAAARLSALSPAELAGRLADRFAVLTGGPRTAEARQRTLRATVDWSHDLLSGPEQAAFRRLSVFQGGWALEAAERVLAMDASAGEALDLLSGLVDRSLVIAEPGHPTRYRMLETLRQYAADRLDDSGETDAFAGRHAAYFTSLADEAEPGLRGHDQRRWLRRLRVEQPNLRAALTWLAAAPGRVDGALTLAGALGWFWHLGRHVEGREVLEQLIQLPGGSPSARARALQAVSLVERPRACLVHPSPRCEQTARESLDLFDAAGDLHRAAFSRVLLAVEGVNGSAAAGAGQLLADADAQFAAEGDAWGHAVTEFVRMETALKDGRDDDALRHGHVAAEVFRGMDDPWGLSAVLYHLGWGLRQFGRYGEAVPVLLEAIDVASSAELHNTAQWATADQGIALLHLGDEVGAQACFARVHDAAADTGDGVGTVLAAYGRGLVARANGDWRAARDRFTVALAGFERLATPVYAGLSLTGLAWCDEHDDVQLASDRYDSASALGQSAGEPALCASALEGLARLAIAGDDTQRARHLLAHAARTRAQAKRPPTPMETVELTELTGVIERAAS